MTAAPMGRYSRIGVRIYKYIYKDASHRVDSFTGTSIDKSIYRKFKMRMIVSDGVFEVWSKGKQHESRLHDIFAF